MAVSPDLFSASSNLLLCAEDADDFASWEEEEDEETGGAAADAEREWNPPALDDDDRGVVASLLAAEPDHLPSPDYLSRLHSCAIDAAARRDAVNWILKVNEFYRFRSVTAWLAVNYLDRFLSSHSLPEQNGNAGWPMQLLSVACVSVAAKMEETHVPLLLDLQILDPPFEFEPRTIRRMELLLASALRWRLRAVTPFDFLHHLAVFPSVSALNSSATALLSRASHIILCTHRMVDFIGYPPSVIAVASFLRAADEIADSSAGDNGGLSSCLFDGWVSKEVVNRCRQLMEEYAMDTCPSVRQEKTVDRSRLVRPRSLVAVLDSAAACVSCDDDTAPRSDDGHPESDPHFAKRRRLGEHPCTERIFTGLDGKPL